VVTFRATRLSQAGNRVKLERDVGKGCLVATAKLGGELCLGRAQPIDSEFHCRLRD
jgi:hypothetical protein